MPRAVSLAPVLLHGALMSACGPRVDAADRPEWLPRWSFAFDVARDREGSFDEFSFEDDGSGTWQVQEFCPLPRATYAAQLRWESIDDDTVAVEAVDSAEDSIIFPYAGMHVEPWDCDEIVYYAATSSNDDVGFRGRTWGRVCVADDGCSVAFCEGEERSPPEGCPN